MALMPVPHQPGRMFDTATGKIVDEHKEAAHMELTSKKLQFINEKNDDLRISMEDMRVFGSRPKGYCSECGSDYTTTPIRVVVKFNQHEKKFHAANFDAGETRAMEMLNDTSLWVVDINEVR